MTESERICNEIGSKFFCKDFVYENLKYFNESNNKVELCDGLFEYAGTYVVLQIKERNKTKQINDDNMWLEDVVYKTAVSQIEETIKGIRNNTISVNDLYHQPVELKKDYLIYAVIIFDNQNIKQYKKVIECNDYKINVFSIDDYKIMMETIIHPYDILGYLKQRLQMGVPTYFIGEGNSSTIISKISTEKDFADSFSKFLYNENNTREAALSLWALMDKYKTNLIKNVPNYKEILQILQLIKPECASGFMERFWYAWEQSCKNKFDLSKNLKLTTDKNENIGITFFSVGTKPFDNLKYYEILCDAKQLQHKLDVVLIIAFIGALDNTCQIDWIYFKRDYTEDANALDFYNKINMFNGIQRETYEYLAKNLISSLK